MGLIDLKTNLKSLKYGQDTLGGGSSGQPYVQNSIPEGFNDLGPRQDFILRGGSTTAKSTAEDIKRLTKMFADTKSPSGVLFVAKQQLLSRTAPRTQTSGILNEGTYLPLNTLTQAGVIAIGGHLNRQGDPFSETGAYANNENLYGVKVKPNPNDPGGSIENNRLVKIYNEKQTVKNSNPNIITYTGGPGSNLGQGLTNIRFADQRTGINNSITVITKKLTTPGNYLKNIYSTDNNKGASGKYARLTNIDITNAYNPDGTVGGYYNFNVYEPTAEGNTFPENSPLIYNNNTFTYNQQNLIEEPDNVSKLNGSPKIQDFRAILRGKLGENGNNKGLVTGATSKSLPYSGSNIEQRVNLGDPGQRANNYYGNYALGVEGVNPADGTPNGKSIYSSLDVTGIGSYQPGLDKINSLPIYRSKDVTSDNVVNDLVKFRIAIIDNDSPNFKTFIHFRAFLDSMSDSYSATWNGFQYLGRSEQFYTYNGFTRQISLGWTVAAQSKQELIAMYKKLNYLASSLTGEYSPNGYMRGVLCQLTVGGYLYEQPGFITALTYDVPNESPWEIAISTTEGKPDSSVKELPHIINVTGFSFTPIQTFIPQLQNNSYNGGNLDGFVSSYGEQRYIALSNGTDKTNYDSQ
jgi:hypothetical protein